MPERLQLSELIWWIRQFAANCRRAGRRPNCPTAVIAFFSPGNVIGLKRPRVRMTSTWLPEVGDELLVVLA